MTNNIDMCEVYQSESQNVKERGYCTTAGNANGQKPNNPAGCAQSGGTWKTVAPFNIPPPDCVAAPVTRDNHLGNDRTGNEVLANLTIPSNAGGIGNDVAQSCAIRLRYNITTADSARTAARARAHRARSLARARIHVGSVPIVTRSLPRGRSARL